MVLIRGCKGNKIGLATNKNHRFYIKTVIIYNKNILYCLFQGYKGGKLRAIPSSSPLSSANPRSRPMALYPG